MLTLEGFPDSIALQHIQSALWGLSETRGAAVMVGAGVSRAATRTSADALPVPLWFEMSQELRRALYPSGGGPIDFLRLAEEYEAALGRNALNELIRTKIDDPNLKFGQIHEDLIALPWTDILTTNWDTLLERAAADSLHRSYSKVLTIGDISRTRAPRIVKLHGSLPSHTPFIFTEEDFRSYPSNFAPFVNLAQQVLMENVLCLVGFSGDDPNFLNWSGWVRDHLGTNAPTIFLVGALELSPAKRRMLEQRRVTPIDFSPVLQHLEKGERHVEALRIFLSSLKNAKPWPPQKWPQTKRDAEIDSSEDDDIDEGVIKKYEAKEKARDHIAEWHQQRITYPGWVVCPSLPRAFLRAGWQDWKRAEGQYKLLDRKKQCGVLFDYAWRFDRALKSFPTEFKTALIAALEECPDAYSRDQRHEIAYWMVREAREARDNLQYDKWASYIRDDSNSTFKTHLAWEDALKARDGLEFEHLQKLIPRISGEDPIWTMRRASLLAELNEENQVLTEVVNALRELRKRSTVDRNSIWVASRLSWAMFVSETVGRFEKPKFPTALLSDEAEDIWPSWLTRLRCNPWDERKHVEEAIDKVVENLSSLKVQVEQFFDLGRSRTTGTGRGWGTGYEVPEVGRFIDQIGVPRSTHFLNLLDHMHATWVKQGNVQRVSSLLRYALHPLSSKDLNQVLNRRAVARLPQETINESIPILFHHLKYCLDKAARPWTDENWNVSSQWNKMGSGTAEIMSRLIIRAQTTETVGMLRYVFDVLRSEQFRHPELWEALDRLLNRGLERLDTNKRVQFLLDAIELKLTSGVEMHSQRDWPDVLETIKFKVVDRTTEEARLTSAIRELIEAVARGGLERERACSRLLQLHQANGLMEGEINQFAISLWAISNPNTGLPDKTGLYSSAFLDLPEPTPGKVRELFEGNVLRMIKDGGLSEDQIVSASQAAAHVPVEKRCYLTKEEAVRWLHSITKRTWVQEREEFGGGDTNYERHLGWCLANAVLPRLESQDIGDDQIDRMLAYDAERSIVIALPRLLTLKPDLFDKVIARIRAGLVSDNRLFFNSACNAVIEIARREMEGTPFKGNPSDLYTEIASTIFQRRAGALLTAVPVAKWLMTQNKFSDADLERIETGLSYLVSELDFHSDLSEKFEHLFLLRKYIVELARVMAAQGRTGEAVVAWLEIGKNDVMPELRDAMTAEIDELLAVN